jgi:glycosyltransferase involved in cell wall biosynthesis
MSPRTALMMAFPLKIFSVKQSLWYSHKHTSLSLKFGKSFLEHIFTASEFSVGFKGKNLSFVRNAVPIHYYSDINLTKPRVGIGSLGRVMPVKRLEILLESLSQLNAEMKQVIGSISFFGPEYLDKNYTEKLIEISRKYSLQVDFIGSVPNQEISKYLTELSIYFTGTLGGIDKSAIEAGLCGCFIVSDNSEALKLVGMDQVYQSLGIQGEISVVEQIEMILTNPIFDLKLRKEIHEFGVQNNSLESLVEKIAQELVPKR